MTINGREYTRDDVVEARYYRADGYILLIMADGVTIRRDVTATLFL